MKKLALSALLAGFLVACGGGGKKDDGVVIVDGNEGDGPPSGVCNPLTQAGCAAGEKCSWIIDQADPDVVGHIGCAPDGTLPIDATGCNPDGGIGPDKCLKGGVCVNDTCKTICDFQQAGAASGCPTDFSCSRYANLFTSGTMTVAGACDPQCDLLTQELKVGNAKAACGSPAADNPVKGCYTSDLQEASCAGIPQSAKGLTDRMNAFGPTPNGNDAFVNGCEAGYLPFFFDKEGSMQVDCTGICGPGETDNTNDAAPNKANAKGDPATPVKLPNTLTAVAGDGRCVIGKKGSQANEECRFIWPFNNDGTNFLDGPLNDIVGVCFWFDQFTYDNDNDAATPNIVVPTCAELPAKGGTAVPPHNETADQEPGCYKKVNSTLSFTNDAIKAKYLQTRVGFPGGQAVKHMIK